MKIPIDKVKLTYDGDITADVYSLAHRLDEVIDRLNEIEVENYSRPQPTDSTENTSDVKPVSPQSPLTEDISA